MIETHRRGPSTLLLWVLFLAPLGAWMVQLFSLYMLEDFISCTPASRTPGLILGVGVRPIALGITAVTGLVTLAAGLAAWSAWKSRRGAGGNGEAPSSWMALAAVMNSVLFFAIIVIKVAPPLLLQVCQRSV